MATQGDVHWKLTTVESVRSYRNFSVVGQFPVPDDGIGYTLNNTVAEMGAHGQRHPLIQWIRGELEVVTVPVVLFSRHSQEDIEQKFQDIKKMRDWDKLLARSPVCRFTYGSILGVLCVVKGLEDVKIFRPRPDGKARRIQFTITLHRYVPYKLRSIDTTKPPYESRAHRVGRLDGSWEMVAAREYGPESALHGDRLRKRNRRQAFAPVIGEDIHIPNRDIILEETVEPEFHAFVRGDEAAEQAVLDKFVARNSLFRVKQRT